MSGWFNSHARHSSGVEPFGSTTSLPGENIISLSPMSCLIRCPGAAASIGGLHNEGTLLNEGTVVSEKTVPNRSATGQQKPFYKRRWFIICQIVTAIIGVVMIFVMLWPIVHAIAQHVLDVSHMHIESSVIQSPSNDSFTVCHHMSIRLLAKTRAHSLLCRDTLPTRVSSRPLFIGQSQSE